METLQVKLGIEDAFNLLKELIVNENNRVEYERNPSAFLETHGVFIPDGLLRKELPSKETLTLILNEIESLRIEKEVKSPFYAFLAFFVFMN